MRQMLNTLFVTTQGTYLARDGECVLVRVEQENRLRVPIHTLTGIVCFGRGILFSADDGPVCRARRCTFFPFRARALPRTCHRSGSWQRPTAAPAISFGG